MKQYICCCACALIIMSPVAVHAKTYVQNKTISNFTIKTSNKTNTEKYRYLDLGFNEKFNCTSTGTSFDVTLYRVGAGLFGSDKSVGRRYTDQIVNRNTTWCYRWMNVNKDYDIKTSVRRKLISLEGGQLLNY